MKTFRPGSSSEELYTKTGFVTRLFRVRAPCSFFGRGALYLIIAVAPPALRRPIGKEKASPVNWLFYRALRNASFTPLARLLFFAVDKKSILK